MISPTSVTDQYSVQPVLINKHRQSLEWLSRTVFWKSELTFFQKLLDETAPKVTDVDGKKQLDHFQHLITYYQGELTDSFRKKLRDHENQLAHALQKRDETDTAYIETHDNLIDELKTFDKQFTEFKRELLSFVEKAM